MNDHENIRRLLSAYCGGDLDSARSTEVEQHLAACAACRREVADLKSALQLIRTTPEVEAPPWLTTRVMARVQEQQSAKRNWMQSFLHLLNIKVPLEALALLLVCVAGYYITHLVNTELKLSSTRQMRDMPVQSAPAPAQKQAGSQKREQAAPIVPSSAPQPLQSPPPKSAQQATSRPVAPPTYAPAPPAREEEHRAAPAAAAGRFEQKSLAPAADSYDRAPQAVSESRQKSARGALRNEAESFPSSAAGSASGKPSALPLPQTTIRLSMADPDTPPGAVREAVIRSGGSISDESELPRQRIKARIPAERINELLKRLEHLGRITGRPARPAGVPEFEVLLQW